MMASAAASGASAQAFPSTPPPSAPRTAFTGGHGGVEAGVHEHHFYIERTDTAGTTGRYHRAWGVGGGAFAGYDAAVSPRLRIGGELGVSVGGDAPAARYAAGEAFSMTPQWGYRATAKLGYRLGERVLAYGTVGYGGHRYRIDNTAGVTGANNWNSSFTIGAGVEYRASHRMGVRLDFRHLDNAMSHILIGVPIRF